jgi:hypothetical protein
MELRRSFSRLSWIWSFSLFPVALPPLCSPPNGGGTVGGATSNGGAIGTGGASIGGGGSNSGVAGEASAGASSAGAPSEGGQAGDGNGPWPEEPLLGCNALPPPDPPEGKLDILPRYPSGVDPSGDSPRLQLRAISGDGHYVVGAIATLPPGYDYEFLRIVRWSASTGFEEITPAIDTHGLDATADTTCDGAIIVGRLPNHSIFRWSQAEGFSGGEPTGSEVDDPRISLDGSTFVYASGVGEYDEYWAYPVIFSHAPGAHFSLDRGTRPVEVSWNGLVLLGYAGNCQGQTPCGDFFRWNAALENPEYEYLPGFAASDFDLFGNLAAPPPTSNCPGTSTICQPLAASSQRNVWLFDVDGELELWTSRHGFRTVDALLPPHVGWLLTGTFLSLDGHVIVGTATGPTGTTETFRAALRADAFD